MRAASTKRSEVPAKAEWVTVSPVFTEMHKAYGALRQFVGRKKNIGLCAPYQQWADTLTGHWQSITDPTSDTMEHLKEDCQSEVRHLAQAVLQQTTPLETTCMGGVGGKPWYDGWPKSDKKDDILKFMATGVDKMDQKGMDSKSVKLGEAWAFEIRLGLRLRFGRWFVALPFDPRIDPWSWECVAESFLDRPGWSC